MLSTNAYSDIALKVLTDTFQCLHVVQELFLCREVGTWPSWLALNIVSDNGSVILFMCRVQHC